MYINSCLCNYVEAFIDHWTTSYDHCEATGLFNKMVGLMKCSLKECYKYSKSLDKYELHMINISHKNCAVAIVEKNYVYTNRCIIKGTQVLATY